MMKILLWFLFYLSSSAACAQTIYIHDISGVAVEAVSVTVKGSHHTIYSDSNGAVDIRKLCSAPNVCDSLIVSHLSFNDTTIVISKIGDATSIRLTNTKYLLTESTVLPADAYAYQSVSGAYRRMKFIDNQYVSYTDGLINYARKQTKNRFLLDRKEYRSSINMNYLDSLPNRTAAAEYVTTPRLPSKYLDPISIYDNESIRYKDSSSYHILSPEGRQVGTIKFNDSTIVHSFNAVHRTSPRKFMKVQITPVLDSVILVFSTVSNSTKPLDHISLDNLKSYVNIYETFIQHKKDKAPRLVKQVTLLCIDNVRYANDINLDEYTFKSGVGDYSSYSYNYWDYINCHDEIFYPKFISTGLIEKVNLYTP